MTALLQQRRGSELHCAAGQPHSNVQRPYGHNHKSQHEAGMHSDVDIKNVLTMFNWTEKFVVGSVQKTRHAPFSTIGAGSGEEPQKTMLTGPLTSALPVWRWAPITSELPEIDAS